jgi:hypothetical protein
MELSDSLRRGENVLSKSKIIICSIVRDCDKNLINNIKVINELCDLAREYIIIIFENDSKDNTKSVLKRWAEERPNIFVKVTDFDVGKTIPDLKNTSVNPFYSKIRIENMANYRNQYMDYLDRFNITGDFLIVVDLDVVSIDLEGVVDSFGQTIDWDAISSNGISLSPRLSKRYHDTYALVELGCQDIPQTEKTIIANQYRFSFLRKGQPLYKVFSAYGGLIIYKYHTVKGLKYTVLYNDDPQVEVRSEHFGLHSQMQERGSNNFFINPSMKIKYQKTNLALIYKTILRKIR